MSPEVERLRAALEKIVEVYTDWEKDNYTLGVDIRVRMARIAREALAEPPA